MSKLHYVLLSLFVLIASASYSADRGYVVGFYNVENLFDTIPSTNTYDKDFLPEGAYKWNFSKYRNKINNIAKVIAMIPFRPDIMGLAEVENRGVLQDLIKSEWLAGSGYDIVHFDSKDERGIDVAMIFRKERFSVIKSERLYYRGVSSYGSRQILYVEGVLGCDTVHVLVAHLPSVMSAYGYRRVAIGSLEYYADSLAQTSPYSKVIVMGDLNVNPNDRLYKKTFGQNKNFKNVFEAKYAKGYGSYLYRNRWNMYDAILLSHGFTNRPENTTSEPYEAHIFIRDFMMQQSGRYKGYPLRTLASGHVVEQGYSDHLPVYVVLQ